jgi:hypothetical protein
LFLSVQILISQHDHNLIEDSKVYAHQTPMELHYVADFAGEAGLRRLSVLKTPKKKVRYLLVRTFGCVMSNESKNMMMMI